MRSVQAANRGEHESGTTNPIPEASFDQRREADTTQRKEEKEAEKRKRSRGPKIANRWAVDLLNGRLASGGLSMRILTVMPVQGSRPALGWSPHDSGETAL